MQQGPRVVVIGLDCGTPKLLFDDLNAEVPTLAKLMGEGMYGDLASITPPITVSAWACGMTGTVPDFWYSSATRGPTRSRQRGPPKTSSPKDS